MVSVVFTKTGCTRSSEYSVRRDLKTQYWSVTAAADGDLKFKVKRTSDPFLSLRKSLSLSRVRSLQSQKPERPKTRIVYQIYFRRISRYHLRLGRHSEMTNSGHFEAILGLYMSESLVLHMRIQGVANTYYEFGSSGTPLTRKATRRQRTMKWLSCFQHVISSIPAGVPSMTYCYFQIHNS